VHRIIAYQVIYFFFIVLHRGEGRLCIGIFLGRVGVIQPEFVQNVVCVFNEFGALFNQEVASLALEGVDTPCTAKTSRPCSRAMEAVIKEPLFIVASTTITPLLKPLMRRFRMGKFFGSGGVSRETR